MTALERRIRERLDEVVDPCSAANGTDLSIIEMGLLDGIDVDEGHVTVSMRLTSPFCMQLPYFVEEVDERVGSIDGGDICHTRDRRGSRLAHGDDDRGGTETASGTKSCPRSGVLRRPY